MYPLVCILLASVSISLVRTTFGAKGWYRNHTGLKKSGPDLVQTEFRLLSIANGESQTFCPGSFLRSWYGPLSITEDGISVHDYAGSPVGRPIMDSSSFRCKRASPS